MRYDFIPGYRIDRLIGKGGMAAVYLATQGSLDRPVALKILRDPDSVEFSERFVNEGRIVASLVHANIITVHDVGIAEGLPYIAMEYVDGGDLKARITTGITKEEALEVVARMALCLAFAHGKGVIHRDLKPANILFRCDGTPLLTDFGIAKSVRLDSHLTATGRIMGTPRYMSPEQALGKAVDGRADLYSLGVMLYEMLAGEPPYCGDSEVDTILRHLNDPLPALPAGCHAYQPLLNRMLAKDPAARFADAQALVDFITTLGPSGRPARPTQSTPRARPVAIPTPPAPARTWRPVGGLWALMLPPVGIALAVALGIAFFRDGGQAPAPTAAPAPPIPVPDAEDLFRRGLAYRHGTGVPADARKAVELFSAAAERGHAAAQHYLGLIYAEGRGVAQDLDRAARWFERAARQNLVEGQHYLCLAYARGRGVARDPVTAYAWCRLAEERGSRDAKESLAQISKWLRDPDIKKAEALARSIAQSLGTRPPLLLNSPRPSGSSGAIDAGRSDPAS